MVVRQVSERLCAALDERANESTVVADVSDVMQAHEHEITVALYHYCTLNTEVRSPWVVFTPPTTRNKRKRWRNGGLRLVHY